MCAKVQTQHCTVNHCISPNPNSVNPVQSLPRNLNKVKKDTVFGKVMQEKETEIEIDKEIRYRHDEMPRNEKARQVFGHGFQIIVYQ